MAKRVFFSFHYKPDNWRASQIRNIGVVEGDAPVSDNDWETITSGGDPSIQTWINNQLSGKSCTIVLIGSQTAGRKWINYEIEQSWNNDKGVLGIYIHGLKDSHGYQANPGNNPFDEFTMKRDSRKLSQFVKAYKPPYTSSTDVYRYISDNLEGWVDDAISIRSNY